MLFLNTRVWSPSIQDPTDSRSHERGDDESPSDRLQSDLKGEVYGVS